MCFFFSIVIHLLLKTVLFDFWIHCAFYILSWERERERERERQRERERDRERKKEKREKEERKLHNLFWLILNNEINEIKQRLNHELLYFVSAFSNTVIYDAPDFEAIVLMIGQQNTRSSFLKSYETSNCGQKAIKVNINTVTGRVKRTNLRD